MSERTLYRVACELDFPNKIVRRALRKYKFKTAGSFVDYLETHLDEFDAEEEGEEPVCGEENITILSFPSKTETANSIAAANTVQPTFREETENLYKRAICLVCNKNRRSFVILPCSHFALCATCESSTRKCPLQDCQEPISCTIQTYGM